MSFGRNNGAGNPYILSEEYRANIFPYASRPAAVSMAVAKPIMVEIGRTINDEYEANRVASMKVMDSTSSPNAIVFHCFIGGGGGYN